MLATPLTPAEIRVLRFLPTHLTFPAIADELFVSRNTVKTQAISIYRKLGVSSRKPAVEAARRHGFLEP
jgi:LuxR family maltose regulon positive regulatory protein